MEDYCPDRDSGGGKTSSKEHQTSPSRAHDDYSTTMVKERCSTPSIGASPVIDLPAIKECKNVQPPLANDCSYGFFQDLPILPYTSWNAVHMEIQENAKLPILNIPIDRSNATNGLQIPAPRGRRVNGLKRQRRATGNDSIMISSASSVSENDAPLSSAVANESQISVDPTSPLPKIRRNLSHREMIDHDLSIDSPTYKAIDEMLRLDEYDMNLSEIFLDEEDRWSASLAYSNSGGGGGASQSHIISRNESKLSFDGITTNSGAFTDVSECEKDEPSRIHNGTTTSKINVASSSKLLPYMRIKPLPIPITKVSLPVKLAETYENATSNNSHDNDSNVVSTNQTMSRAIVTAETIATTSSSMSGTPNGVTPEQSTTAALSMQPANTAAALILNPTLSLLNNHFQSKSPNNRLSPSNTETQIAENGLPKLLPQLQQFPLPKNTTYPYPHGAVGYNPNKNESSLFHSKSQDAKNTSLAHTLAQRSKFGFGSSHNVVSTPIPPPNTKGFPLKQTINNTNHPNREKSLISAPFHPIYTMQKPTIMPDTTIAEVSVAKLKKPSGGEKKEVSVNIDAPAYKRKKQRAKDARIKLNEAIEELATSIELAGSLSKERLSQMSRLSSTWSSSDSISLSNVKGDLAKLMEDTINETNNAKKWDRPSLVALSATVIHCMNAQCEGLMREFIQLKHEMQQWSEGNSSSITLDNTNITINADKSFSVNIPCQKEANMPTEKSMNQILPDPTSKRQKINEEKVDKAIWFDAEVAHEEWHHNILLSAGSPMILKQIASFLDPTTLCRCLSVSKHWISLHIFQNHKIWLELCLKRFGTTAVRKRESNKDDDEDTATSQTSLAKHLYREMAEENVKPICSLEGTISLGVSTLDRMVSAWVSLIERSNGETSRSVMCNHSVVEGKSQCIYSPTSVVELRILIQNTGYSNGALFIPDQHFSVDASTRRKCEKMLEITSDERFKRQVLHIERRGSDVLSLQNQKISFSHEMCHLRLFEYAVLSVHIHARGCSTSTKFCHRAKKIQILVSLDGMTRPLIVPIMR